MAQRLIVVSISGGKDSTATAQLALDQYASEHVRLVMADTGHEHEITLHYVQRTLPDALAMSIEIVRADFSRQIASKRAYVEGVWPAKGVPGEIVQRALSVLHPTGVPFLDLCLWKGRFPSRTRQFCTQFLKRLPLDAYLLDRMAEGYEVESWRGIRRDESHSRRDALDRELTAEGYWIVHAIAAWSAQQVIDFLRDRGLPLNPLYRQGMRRVGCMPCINCAKDELLEISQRWPAYIDVIREWEELVSLAAKRGWTTFFCDSALEGETDTDIFQRLRIDERVRWAATARGGRQLDLIRAMGSPACSSLYGLCE